MSSATPRVTIGLPVYNGARHLKLALDSLLAQTLTDFEIIVSDNASTDDSPAILHDYAARDSRIRYIRQPVNIGAPANWNFVARDALGRYFKWASGNDVVAPSMLERCVEVLEREPGVSLCYGRTELIDDDGRPQGIYEEDIEVRDARPSDRFRHVCRDLKMNNAQSGLIRYSSLLATRFDRPYPAGDMVLMAELAMLGGFALLPEVLLYRRWAPRSSSSQLSNSELKEFFAPGVRSKAPLSFIHWRRHLDYLGSALCSPVSAADRGRAAGFALRQMIWARSHLGAELMAPIRRLWGR